MVNKKPERDNLEDSGGGGTSQAPPSIKRAEPTMNFKDLFSTQSTDYAKFRPTYPEALFGFLASLSAEHRLAWDCGCGNGQASVQLAGHFDQVVATDPSEKQLAGAVAREKVKYETGTAEESSLADRTVDLITTAQAFHWFKQDRFFDEVRRVAKPSGVLAVWCYGLCRITPQVDAVVGYLYNDILDGYWEPERKLVEEGYRNVQFPFKPISPPLFEMRAEWNFEHTIGYLGTWSALQTFVKKNGSNPLEPLASDLYKAWGGAATLPVTWDLAVRAFRVQA
ncbi:MAG: SAM-dependent methyltransferase [Bdellovibrio sp.]|nr:MAG: SAM-dependent methyltransferase [Bdellovibrio sp.]